MKSDAELTKKNIKNLAELTKASIKLTARKRFEILENAQKLAMQASTSKSLAETEKLLKKARKLAEEI